MADGGGIELLIDAGQQPWAPDIDPGTVVSSLQTGEFAGPPGSTIGQHRFRRGLTVREAQANVRLHTPRYGLIECRAAAVADPANMVALWLIGYEDEPRRSGEICVFEIFGRDVGVGQAKVGMGIHPFADPDLVDDFEQLEIAIDAQRAHDYAVEWQPGLTIWYVDGARVKASRQAPDYQLQLMLNVYEFRAREQLPSPAAAYPKVFSVEWLRSYAPAGQGTRERGE